MGARAATGQPLPGGGPDKLDEYVCGDSLEAQFKLRICPKIVCCP